MSAIRFSLVISAYFLIYAFNPMITGFPSIIAVVVWLPWLEATIRVLPLADGVGVCISTVIINSFPLISTFILFSLSFYWPAIVGGDCLVDFFHSVAYCLNDIYANASQGRLPALLTVDTYALQDSKDR